MNQSNLMPENKVGTMPNEGVKDTQEKFLSTSLLIGAICIVLLAGSAGYYLGRSSAVRLSSSDQSVTAPSEAGNDDQSIHYNSTNSDLTPQVVSLEELGIFIEFPTEFGSTVKNLVKQPTDSGNLACSEEKIEGIEICAVSRHFTAGRGGNFTDNHGYLPSPNGFYVLFPFSEAEVGSPLAEKYLSNSKVEILKIKGKSEQTEFGNKPVDGTPGEGYIAAIINTQDSDNYDGVTIVMKLSDNLTEQDVNKILDSVRIEK